MADHLLHWGPIHWGPIHWGPIHWGPIHWVPWFWLECNHAAGAYPVVDDNGEPDPGFDGVCWASDWSDWLDISDITFVGDWSEPITFPVAVEPVWDNGLTFHRTVDLPVPPPSLEGAA